VPAAKKLRIFFGFRGPQSNSHLILRRRRSRRLEGWPQISCCPPPISGLPEIGTIECASRQQPTCVSFETPGYAAHLIRNRYTSAAAAVARMSLSAARSANTDKRHAGPRARKTRISPWRVLRRAMSYPGYGSSRPPLYCAIVSSAAGRRRRWVTQDEGFETLAGSRAARSRRT
jgi:hypothetical protein